MSDPIWCEVRRRFCRCLDFGRKCEDYDEAREQLDAAAMTFMGQMSEDDTATVYRQWGKDE